MTIISQLEINNRIKIDGLITNFQMKSYTEKKL